MWARKRLDIGWSDLAFALCHCGFPHDRSTWQQRVEAAWSDSGDALACLSVRSGFDLLLDAWSFPAGSEVLLSALTIHDMPRIVAAHGLVPVPVDLDVDRLSPRLDSLQRAISPAARAIVVAHLFGSRVPMEPILEVARRHGLMVVEDCAQAFDGSRGHPEVDASLFSFGAIKTATALQGAIVQVRDGELLQRMRRRQAGYAVQKSTYFCKRLLKYASIKAALCRPPFTVLFRVLLASGCDADRLLNRTARGFPGLDLLAQIRRQPSAPLLALLERRLRGLDASRLSERIARAERLAELLGSGVPRPGTAATAHSHWVFPILSDEPPRIIAALRRAGFDATQGQSMCVVPAPADRSELSPTAAAKLLAQAVYLPLYADMPLPAMERMARVVRDAVASGP